MAQYAEVELVDGRMVRVYRTPNRRIIAMVEKKFPRPEPPVVTETTAQGKEVSMVITDNPEYIAALAQWEETMAQEVDMLGSLFMFKDVKVPDDWDIEAEVGTEVRFYDSEWQPRDGPMGRKLDYIEWSIMGDVANSQRVLNALVELAGIDSEEVASNEASFRDNVEGATP